MSLTKTDLDKITNVIKATYELVSARMDKMEENMNRRFDENDRQHVAMHEKIDQLSTRENEDLFAVNEDIRSMKSRLKKVSK